LTTSAAPQTPAPSAGAIQNKLKLAAFGNTDASETELVILPDPVGYNMLIALPTMEQQTAGGIIIPETVSDRERAATVVGVVLAMGNLCYKDEARFHGEPWCKVGDTVLFSRYSGMRFRAKDFESGDMVEYRMLADDQIVGTVPKGAQVGAL
jgi:co-chaperonin GroES (HSP10)